LQTKAGPSTLGHDRGRVRGAHVSLCGMARHVLGARSAKSLLIVALFFLGSVAAATVPTFQEVEEALTCQCGCGLTVHSCNHLQCGFAVPAKQEIARQFGEGKSRDEIVATFLTRYGEKVLSAPTTTGFNLAAWIMPFLAVVVGGVLIGLASLRWSRRNVRNESARSPAPASADQYRDRLKRELDAFDN